MFATRSLLGLVFLSAFGIPPHSFLEAQQPTPDNTGNPYAELDEVSARKLVKGCTLPHEVNGPGEPGSQIVLQFTVSEKGKLLGVRRVQGAFTHQLGAAFASCHFAPYKVNGTPTPFRADIVIDVK